MGKQTVLYIPKTDASQANLRLIPGRDAQKYSPFAQGMAPKPRAGFRKAGYERGLQNAQHLRKRERKAARSHRLKATSRPSKVRFERRAWIPARRNPQQKLKRTRL